MGVQRKRKKLPSLFLTFILFLSTLTGCEWVTRDIKDTYTSDYDYSTLGTTEDEDITSYYDDEEVPVFVSKLHSYRIGNGIGSARTFSGKLLVHCFFVDDSESSWSKLDAEAFLSEKIQPALDFLSAEAEKWGTELTFDTVTYTNEESEFSLKYNGKISNNHTGSTSMDLFEQLAGNMGYKSDKEYTRADTEKNKDYTDTVYLVLVNKSGRSYARSCIMTGDRYIYADEYTEYAVVYSKMYDTLRAYPSTVAHEILHLFGAEDFYGTQRRQTAEKNYRDDIMLMNKRELENHKIEGMTAFLVGWSDEVPELCYDESWVSGRKADV